MPKTLISSFEIPGWIFALCRFLGVQVVTRHAIQGPLYDRYVEAGAGVWVATHSVVKRMLTALEVQDVGNRPLAATVVSGLPEDRVRARLVQQINISFCFDILFTACAQAVFGGKIVLAAPPAIRQILIQSGLPVSQWLSQTAWWWLRLRLLGLGLVANILHGLRAVRDELNPDQLPEWSRGGKVGVWPMTYAGGFSEDPAKMSVSHFFRTGAIEAFRDCDVLMVSNADADAWITPPMVKVRHVFAARRGRGSRFGVLRRMFWEQIRLAGKLILGDWREILLARETAQIPRARLYVDEVKPAWIIGALANIASPNLWYELARQQGAQLYIICYSAQVTAIHRREEMHPGHIPHIYMQPVADRFGAWTPTHARALASFGIPLDKIEVAGPMVYSARPLRVDEPLEGRKLRIDYFDQVPYQAPPIDESGIPVLYWTVDRLTRTVREVVQALSQTLPAGSYRLRIKSKKVVQRVDADYFSALADLAAQHPEIELLDWRTSALSLNADSDLTISFPFASPSIAARWYGVPACFYDVDAAAAQDPLIIDGLPVLTGVNALAQWVRVHYDSLRVRP